MKLTPELKLRAAIHLLCQANHPASYADMAKAVEQLATDILKNAGKQPVYVRDDAHLAEALRRFDNSLAPNLRSV